MGTTQLSRRILLWVVTGGISIALTLAIAEIFLRAIGRSAAKTVYTASDPIFQQIPGVYNPGQNSMDVSRPDLPHHVGINSLGYRGPEINLHKAQGVIRILCLGDSFTFGSYINDNDTYPSLLQENFSKRGLAVEVINGGVEHTTIVDHIYFLKKSMPVNPDFVILTFFENDIDDLARWEPVYVSLAKYRAWKSGWIVGSILRLVRESAIFNVATQLWAARDFSREQKTIKELSPEVKEVLWSRYASVLREMKSYLDGQSVRLVFAAYPSYHRLGKNSEEMQTTHSIITVTTKAESLAEELKIPTINLLDPLKRSRLSARELYLTPIDVHPRRSANEIVAEVMYEFLRQEIEEALRGRDRMFSSE